jgi:prepilin-type N-terminal cleavage/methylation domain-containing protein
MRHGVTLVELSVVLAIVAIVMAITMPRLMGIRDWIAVNAAAEDVTTSIAVAREAAIMQGARTRAVIAADSLRIDRWQGDTWGPLHRWPGPVQHGVTLAVTNPVIVFDPIGLGWGFSNTGIELRRGDRVEKITVSRVGRVKRW